MNKKIHPYRPISIGSVKINPCLVIMRECRMQAQIFDTKIYLQLFQVGTVVKRTWSCLLLFFVQKVMHPCCWVSKGVEKVLAAAAAARQ